MKPIYPIDRDFFVNPTKIKTNFGDQDTLRLSGIHNGTDFACPVGTPIVAPVDGRVHWRCDNHVTMGAAVYFRFEIGGVTYYSRFLHLSKAMPMGEYKQGEVIGYTGKSGQSTGPHLHLEAWKTPINIDHLKTAKLVREHLYDPVLFWRGLVEGGTCAGDGL